MVIVTKGDFIWIEPITKGQFTCAIGARVVDSEPGRVKIVDDQGNEHWLGPDRRIKIMHPTSIQGVEDMIQLGDLHEAGILRNLFVRYKEKLIYTFTGSILIAVNPYQNLPIYTADQIRLYKDKRIGELPPHIFAITDNAYTMMRRFAGDQCIIISGESGSGKTESTKLVLQFLATISGQHSWIEQQVLEANPIMEAFGNAKTIRNDNSSRFGKYIDIHFNASGAIEGAKIEQYLLEKSRIVSQAHNERNYHIFYCMLAGLSATEKQQLDLIDASQYYYLTQGKSLNADGRDDAADLTEIRTAMKVLMFSDQEIWSLFRILAGLLHIGNIKYNGIIMIDTSTSSSSATIVNNLEATEIRDAVGICRAAKNLQVDERSLINALTTKTIVTREERVVSCLTAEQSLDVRDALVKGIYGRLFVWIVKKINCAIYRPRKEASRRYSIGVLDIFGFEDFEQNSFEQLCINFANEHLQQFFVRHIFKLEQIEYDNEQINWRKIEFVDNQETLDILAHRPMNILSLIDEESKFPKGTDQTMLNKLHATHGRSIRHYVKPKSDLNKSFGINHFAGVVLYNAKGFLEKNRDTFSSDLRQLVHTSKFRFMLNLFEDDNAEDYGSSDTASRRKQMTVGAQFRRSLEQLMIQLELCEPFFIRCIKPNEYKRALMFDRDLVCKQLRYSGMMETIRIRKAGYPIRHDYVNFVDRYRLLVNGIGASGKIDCHAATITICTRILGTNADYQLGRSKVFLKEAQDTYLEQERDRMLTIRVVTIQKMIRGWYQRKQYQRQRRSAIIIQKHWRAHAQRRRYQMIHSGFARLQAVLRSRQLVFHYRRFRSTIIQFQARCRGAIIRRAVRVKRQRGERRIIDNDEQSISTDRAQSPTTITATANGTDEMDDSRLVEQMFGFLPTDTVITAAPLQSNGGGQFADLKSASDTMLRSTTLPDSRVLPDENEDLSGYQFGKFATTYFQGQQTAVHIRRPLRTSLLPHENTGDQIAALAVWITILRFMGDLHDPKINSSTNGSPLQSRDKTPVMTKLYTTLGRNFSKREVEQAQQAVDYDSNTSQKIRKGSVRQKLISMTLRRKTKLGDDIVDRINSNKQNDDITVASDAYNALLDNRPTSNLDKLHFIIGHGILRADLRDEIYCQICKQLSSNPSKNSHARGWILLSLCVGCFAPTDKFSKYLRCFIREQGPMGYNTYCEQRLSRTVLNGTRHQPPSYMELQATKSKKLLILPITFMDGTTKTLLADSATTADEICRSLSDKIGLKDQFGFSLYIALFDKVSSLGSGSDHVMDAVSQCEQYAKEQGAQERNAPWRLFFRKEIFSPWHDVKSDAVCTNLIYQQVVRGIKYGEYRCEKEEDLATLTAQQYYIDHGSEMNINKLTSSLSTYIPEFALNTSNVATNRNGSNEERWIQLILHAFRKTFADQHRIVDQLSLKEDIVTFAQFKWPLLFSRFYEAYKFAGPPLPQNEVIIAVNWTGVYVVDDQEQVLLEFTFPEITAITCTQTKRLHAETFTIVTVGGDEYTFQSPNAEDIKQLVVFFLDGLKRRSKYVIALQDQKSDPDGTYLSFAKGDLLLLSDEINGEMVMNQAFAHAENIRTGEMGDFISENVHILPTITKPTLALQELFARQTDRDATLNRADYMSSSMNGSGIDRPHTLQLFAMNNFRPSSKKSTLNSVRKSRHRSADDLWRHTKEPLKVALLNKLIGKDEPTQEAVLSFLAIMKYMGDHPSGQRARIGTELTDQVFAAPLKYEIVRDETYCQLMKQLTDNRIRASEERGWELLWLCVGLFAPSQSLFKEVTQFLRTRQHPVAADCYNRLQKTSRSGQRKYPPHQVEVEAIQHKTTQIFHKVYFPDDTNEAVEVDSSTRARDFCQKIANRLQLQSAEGFSLFVKIADKVISVPEGDFFFDFVRQLTDWIRKNRPTRDGSMPQFTYQVFFLKKLWTNTVPGLDRNADLIFHYHQELPKYLRGYHKCSRNDAIELAALIMRARCQGDQPANIHQLPQILAEIVPKDLLKSLSAQEWKRTIVAAYNGSIQGLPTDDAKICFLKMIAKWPTFGSAFFEVKQSSDPTMPDRLLIAINKNGVNLINPESKDILVTYPFTRISNWSSGNTYFHMTVGNLMKGNRLLLETTLGYKMDDLLTSYIGLMLSTINRVNGGGGNEIDSVTNGH